MSLIIRRYWILAAIFILSVLALVCFAGQVRVSAVVSSGSGTTVTAISNVDGVVDLFDDSIVHAIEIIVEDGTLDRMASTFTETGRKDWFPASIRVDGTLFAKVGIRLKGNSTLESIFGKPHYAEEDATAEQAPPPPMVNMTSSNKEISGQGTAPKPRRPVGNSRPPQNMQHDEPMLDANRNTPYLIKFDQYVPGLRYQGRSEIALRVRGHMQEDAALLAELVTREAMAVAGVPAPALAYAGVSFNNGSEMLYLVSEHLDEAYIEKVSGKNISDSILYKTLPKSQFVYRGEDPSAYDSVFSQETNKKHDDLKPLIKLLRFVTVFDSEKFQSEIYSFIDVDALASYLAANNVFSNIDSLGGNGNNYYLLYDKALGKFTVLAWDMNESFGQFWMADSDPAALDASYSAGFPRQHPLLEKMLKNKEFKMLYEKKIEALADAFFTQKKALELVNRYQALIESANASRNLVDLDAYRESADWARAFISRRTEYFQSQTTRH